MPTPILLYALVAALSAAVGLALSGWSIGWRSVAIVAVFGFGGFVSASLACLVVRWARLREPARVVALSIALCLFGTIAIPATAAFLERLAFAVDRPPLHDPDAVIWVALAGPSALFILATTIGRWVAAPLLLAALAFGVQHARHVRRRPSSR